MSPSGKEPEDLESRSTPGRQNAARRRIRKMTKQFPKKWAAKGRGGEDGSPTPWQHPEARCAGGCLPADWLLAGRVICCVLHFAWCEYFH